MGNEFINELEELFGPMNVITIDCGGTVLCDFCNKDYTESDESGGFIFGSNAVCPDCADKTMVDIKKYNEEKYIRSKCPEGTSFSNFVRSIR